MIKKILILSLIIGSLIGTQSFATSHLVKFLERQESNLNKSTGCLVLNYHIVKERNLLEKALNTTFSQKDQKEFTVSKKSFEEQILFLKENGAYFITPEELHQYLTNKNVSIPDKCVLITFDDADESVYTTAYPILERENIPSLIFIVTNQVGNKDYDGLSLLDWEQIEELKKSDLITFGTHTHDMHYQTRNGKAPFINKKNLEGFKKDTNLSIGKFKKEFGIEPTYFAYPYGFGIPETDQVLKDNQFKMIFSLREGLVQKGDSPFFVKRFLVSNDNWWIVEEWVQKVNHKTK